MAITTDTLKNNSLPIKKNKFKYLYVLVLAFLLVVIPMLSTLYVTPYSPDFYNYLTHFNGYKSVRFEIGYQFLVSFFKLFSENIFIFWFICASATLAIKTYLAYSYGKTYNGKIVNSLFFLVCYIPSVFLLHEITQIRTSIAIAFIALSLLLLLRREKILLSFLFFMAAVFFHKSTLFLIIIYPIYILLRIRGGMYFYYAGLITASLLIYNYLDFYELAKLNSLVENYIDFNEVEFNPLSVSLILVYTFILFSLFNINKANFSGSMLFNIYASIIIIGFALSQVPVISIRVMDVSMLFGIYYTLSFPLSSKLKIIPLYLILLMMSFHKFYAFIYYNPMFNF